MRHLVILAHIPIFLMISTGLSLPYANTMRTFEDGCCYKSGTSTPIFLSVFMFKLLLFYFYTGIYILIFKISGPLKAKTVRRLRVVMITISWYIPTMFILAIIIAFMN